MVCHKVLICSFLVFWGTDRSNAQIGDDAQAEVRSEIDAINYLSGRNWIPAKQASETVDLKDLLRNFQIYTGLPVTGILDEATKAKMNSPQCGNPDFGEGGFTLSVTRKKRYTHSGSRWPHEITWFLENGTPDLDLNIVRSEMTRAFQHWADVTPLTFREVFSTNADIIVKFAVRDHGDGNSFDGPGRVLAHAFQPGSGIGGDLHFDDDELFTTSTGINLLQVAVHEVGHSLGLGHSSDTNAIMAPYYIYRANFALGTDDINGIQALYGLYGENRHALCEEVPQEEGRTVAYTGNSGNRNQHSSVLVVTCADNMVRFGQNTSTCLDGTWSPPVAHCRENHAHNKQAYQESTDLGGSASLAVDGNTDGSYMTGRSCSHTRNDARNHWWYVDLGSSILVTEVVIYNRQDSNHHTSLLNAKVRVGEYRSSHVVWNDLAGTVTETEVNPIRIEVNPVIRGRIVSVSEVTNGNPLTLCEVQVFGQLPACPNGCEVPLLGHGYFTMENLTSDTPLHLKACVTSAQIIYAHCQEGWTLQGRSSYYTCQPSGEWLEQQGVDLACSLCQNTECVVPYIEDGHYSARRDGTPLEEGTCLADRNVLYVVCHDGMQLNGSFYYQCNGGVLLTGNNDNVLSSCSRGL